MLHQSPIESKFTINLNSIPSFQATDEWQEVDQNIYDLEGGVYSRTNLSTGKREVKKMRPGDSKTEDLKRNSKNEKAEQFKSASVEKSETKKRSSKKRRENQIR